MKNYTVKIKKLTDADLMREACQTTYLGGKTRQNLSSIYRSEHSPARTQMFWIKLENIPLASSTHLIRAHVGSQAYQLTCRPDRHGGNPDLPGRIAGIKKRLLEATPENFQEILEETTAQLDWIAENTDRQTPVNLGLLVNAQSLIDTAKLRLCWRASPETQAIFEEIRWKIAELDPDLAAYMVPKCIYRNGLCCEDRCCGYNSSVAGLEARSRYLSLFTDRQKGV